MSTFPLASDGVFWTLQGEGALSGEPMAFVRLAGCSVGCPECDTDYRVVERVTVKEIVRRIQLIVPAGFWPWVWITGGEPLDHDITPLVDCLRTINFRVALATSGNKPIQQAQLYNWISVSPHVAEPVQRFGHEIKVVPALNGLTWGDVDAIDNWCHFPYKFIQPLYGADVQPHIDFVLSHPGWRLTSQAHKPWGLK